MRRIIFLLILTTSSLSAAEQKFESGPTKTHLLELYTSEGCSSCPAAEAWLSELKNNPQLWRDFAPLAFHVDYWDRLGWRDPFASKVWTTRQYQYSERWKSSSVYTPGFVLDGREWRNNAPPSASTDSPGTLKIEIEGDNSINATFASKTDRPLDLHVARRGFGLTSKVRAGENSGRTLQHDFVVLAMELGSMNNGKASVALPSSPAQATSDKRQALVAWVTARGQIEPIQAAGDWLR
jgi:hypothetical protein